MSDTNIQVVKDMFERFRAGDGPGFLALLTDDVYWDHRGPNGAPFNRLYEGREAVAGFLEDLGGAEEALLVDDREYFASGDRVVCIGFMRFRAIASVSCASLLIEPYDMAPVWKRFMIDSTDSTSSRGIDLARAFKRKRPRKVARFTL